MPVYRRGEASAGARQGMGAEYVPGGTLTEETLCRFHIIVVFLSPVSTSRSVSVSRDQGHNNTGLCSIPEDAAEVATATAAAAMLGGRGKRAEEKNQTVNQPVRVDARCLGMLSVPPCRRLSLSA